MWIASNTFFQLQWSELPLHASRPWWIENFWNSGQHHKIFPFLELFPSDTVVIATEICNTGRHQIPLSLKPRSFGCWGRGKKVCVWEWTEIFLNTLNRTATDRFNVPSASLKGWVLYAKPFLFLWAFVCSSLQNEVAWWDNLIRQDVSQPQDLQEHSITIIADCSYTSKHPEELNKYWSGTVVVAQWPNRLLYKHEHLSVIPSICTKVKHSCAICSHSTGMGGSQGSEGLAGSQSRQAVSCRFHERSCLRKQCREHPGRGPRTSTWSPHAHMWIYTYMYTHMHMCTYVVIYIYAHMWKYTYM